MSQTLTGPPEPYHDWHAWALAQFDNDPRRAGLAARAAHEAQSVGAEIDAAMRAARNAAGAQPPSWVPNDVSLKFTSPPQVPQPPPDPLNVAIAEPVPKIGFTIPTTVPDKPANSLRVSNTESSTTASHLGSRVLSRLRDDRPVAAAIALLVLLIAGSSVAGAQRLLASPAQATEQASRVPYTVPSPVPPNGAGTSQNRAVAPPGGSQFPRACPSGFHSGPNPGQCSRDVICPAGYTYVPSRFGCVGSGQATFSCPTGYAPFAKAYGCYTPGPEVPLPSPIGGATMRYYDVSGSTAEEVIAQMRSIPPPCSGDVPANTLGSCPAYTHGVGLAFSIDSTTHSADGSCTIRSVSIAGYQEVVAPRWTPSPGAPAELYGSWKRWLTGVYAHESGHVQINAIGFDSIRRSAVGAPCDQFSQIVAQGEAQIASEQHNYHLATNYGQKQGPPFP